MTLPLFVVPLAAAVGASLLVGLAYLLFERPRNLAGPPIDMSKLTNDDRATASPEETLERAERLRLRVDPLPVDRTDPAKFTTAQLQAAHRTLAQEMATKPVPLFVPSSWIGRHR